MNECLESAKEERISFFCGCIFLFFNLGTAHNSYFWSIKHSLTLTLTSALDYRNDRRECEDYYNINPLHHTCFYHPAALV